VDGLERRHFAKLCRWRQGRRRRWHGCRWCRRGDDGRRRCGLRHRSRWRLRHRCSSRSGGGDGGQLRSLGAANDDHCRQNHEKRASLPGESHVYPPFRSTGVLVKRPETFASGCTDAATPGSVANRRVRNHRAHGFPSALASPGASPPQPVRRGGVAKRMDSKAARLGCGDARCVEPNLPRVLFRSRAREKVLTGVNTLADAVRVTLGPSPSAC